MNYEIVKQNVSIRGYLSDIASHKLFMKGTFLTKTKKEVVLNNATILFIKKELFTKRKGIVKELDHNEIAGNVYFQKDYAVCLIFPIDLVFQKHVKISKWRFT